jgi:hypothetical protein
VFTGVAITRPAVNGAMSEISSAANVPVISNVAGTMRDSA